MHIERRHLGTPIHIMAPVRNVCTINAAILGPPNNDGIGLESLHTVQKHIQVYTQVSGVNLYAVTVELHTISGLLCRAFNGDIGITRVIWSSSQGDVDGELDVGKGVEADVRVVDHGPDHGHGCRLHEQV